MIFRKYNCLTWVALIVAIGVGFGCVHHKKPGAIKLTLNSGIVDSLANRYGNKLAILSCLRCDCFRIEYNNRFIREGKIPKGYVLLTDTGCTKMKFPVVHIPGGLIDRISDDIYNLVLIKKNGNEINYRILTVDESRNIEKWAGKFFSN